MSDHTFRIRWAWILTLVPLLLSVTASLGLDLTEVKHLLDARQYDQAIERLSAEVVANPAHEAARILLAQAYESAGKEDDALRTWKELLILSHNETNRQKGRRALARIRRRRLDAVERTGGSEESTRTDPFNIPMPKIDWKGLEVIEDTNYRPPVFVGGKEAPPFDYETEHFTVYSTNERLSKVIGDRAEAYLEFMLDRFFGGRSWAVRFPILVYQDYADYTSHGAPKNTAGVTYSSASGKTKAILMYQLNRGPGGRGRGGGTRVFKYGIESVLTHELTHAMLNEFFEGRRPPRWLHEAVAGRFEQTRDHYGDAARLARKVVAGEYFRMRDLFKQKEYPQPIDRTLLFYEQSATVVLYLFETGPVAMHAFLTELAAGHDHDAACAAALGIPEENAVEEFERRWVEWMKMRYLKDLDNKSDGTILSTAQKSDDPVFRPWVNELDTIKKIKDWRTIDLNSLEAFAPMDNGSKEWKARDGKLTARPLGDNAISLLAVRMNETAPAVLRCRVKCLADPGKKDRLFGFTQLDDAVNDTRVSVLAPLRDNEQHTLVGIWSDDLAVYLDGKCVGRYPARRPAEDAPDVDYPIALTACGPMEIQDLEVASIKSFSKEPIVVEADKKKDDRSKKRTRRSRRTRRGRKRKP